MTDFQSRAETVLHSRIIPQVWTQLTPADIVQIAIRLIYWEMRHGRMYDFDIMRHFAEEQLRMRPR